MNTEPLTTGYGEYPATSSSKLADTSNSLPTETLPAQTEDFSQFQTTTNQINMDTQIPDIQTNFDTNDFASVNVLQSDGTSSEAQMGQYTNSTTENVDFTTTAEATTFDSNAQMDFGATNTFTENTTTNVEGMDLGTNVETQYGEYQASSPIINTAESAQITGNFNMEAFGTTETTTTNIENVNTNVDYNAATFQSVEPEVDLGAMTTSTPTFEANNFDFTTSDSIVGATSALNNIESTNYSPSEPIVDTTATNFEMNNINFTASTPTVDTTPAFDTNAFTTTGQEFTATTTTETTTTHSDLTHELVEPNPVTINKNFADEQILNRASVPAKLDINAIAKAASTQPVVESTPSFDTTAFTATSPEPVMDTTTNIDLNAFSATTTEPVVESTPTFDATAFTTNVPEPVMDTTTNIDLNAFTATTTEPVVESTPTFDSTAFTQSEPIVDTTFPTVDQKDITTTTSEPVVDTTPAFDTSAFTQPIGDTTQAFDANAFTTIAPEP